MAVRAVAVGGVVFLALGFIRGNGEDPARPMLILYVTNVADVSTRVLRRAEQEVSAVYRGAGVGIRFADRSSQAMAPHCASVDIILLSHDLAKIQVVEYGLQYDDLGYAIRPAHRAYILWPRIRDVEVQYSKDAGEVLGLVIAHEVGHLLLPADAHSSVGIMRPEIDLKAQQRPRFTRSEAQRVRAALAASGGNR
jgi:hypothetical protein